MGIYAGDPDYLVPKYALPKLYDLEQDYGSFIGGAIKKARQPKSDRDKKATREVFSVEGGLENLIKALAQAVGSDNIILNARDISVNKTNASYEVSCFVRDEKMTLITDILVSTTASPEVRDLMPFLDQDIIEGITQLEYARVAEISLGFRNWKGMDLNAFGGLVPYRENREILGALFLSSFFKDRAPKDGAMISVFAGGFRKPGILDMNNEALIDVVKSEVMDMLQLDEFKPDILKIFRYEYAIPQYGASSGKRIEAVQKAQQQNPGLFIAGNLRDGIGMADRIKQGRAVAEAIIKAVP
ncbi:MAG: protoporphyrinogen oxidase [Bacteroidota bacterium]|nr:protoporphyrinogen oxidase [Bacteroidota bacterium]